MHQSMCDVVTMARLMHFCSLVSLYRCSSQFDELAVPVATNSEMALNVVLYVLYVCVFVELYGVESYFHVELIQEHMRYLHT